MPCVDYFVTVAFDRLTPDRPFDEAPVFVSFLFIFVGRVSVGLWLAFNKILFLFIINI